MVGHWWVCHLAETNILQGFPDDAVVKNLPANAGDTGEEGLIPGSGRFPEEGNGNPLQYSCLEDSMDRGTCPWSPWSHKEVDMTQQLSTHAVYFNECIMRLKACYSPWGHSVQHDQATENRGFSSLQFSCSVTSNSLQPHGPQHAKLPCLSPTPRACSNSCSSSWWCHPAISSSVVLFSFCLQSFPALGSFPRSQFFASGGQSIGVLASASVSPSNEYSGLISWQSSLEDKSVILDLVGSNQSLSCLWLCHSFKVCALPLSSCFNWLKWV